MAFEIQGTSFRSDTTFNCTSWPENVSHRSPRMIWIGSEITFTIISNLKSWAPFTYFKVHDACFVRRRLDGIEAAIFTQIDGAAIGMEAEMLIIETVVFEIISRPQVWSFAIRIEYFGVKLASGPDATYY